MSRFDVEARTIKPHAFRPEERCRWCGAGREDVQDGLISAECLPHDPVQRLFLDEIALLDAGAAAYVKLAEHLEGRAEVARSKARILLTQRETLARSMPLPIATPTDAA